MRSHLLALPLCLTLVSSPSCRSAAPQETPEPPETSVAVISDVAVIADGESQLSENHRAWQTHGARLAAESPGAWVLIAGGEVLGVWPGFEKAWDRAEELPQAETHAYLYRAGVDDVPITFLLSPFLSTEPHWVQLGRRIRKGWGLTMYAADNSWERGGLRVVWGDMEARILSLNPETSSEHKLRAVASNLFEHDLTLKPEDARALHLGRFTAPLPAFYLDEGHPCEKVILRIRIPELDISVPAVAFVLPEDQMNRSLWDPEWPAEVLQRNFESGGEYR